MKSLTGKFLIAIYDFKEGDFEAFSQQYRIVDYDDLMVNQVQLENSGNSFDIYEIGPKIYTSK